MSSECNSRRKPLPSPEQTAHVTAAAHVTPRQITHGYAPVSGRGTRWADRRGAKGKRRREFFTRNFLSGGAVLSFPALLPLPTPCRSSESAASCQPDARPCEIPPARRDAENARSAPLTIALRRFFFKPLLITHS